MRMEGDIPGPSRLCTLHIGVRGLVN